MTTSPAANESPSSPQDNKKRNVFLGLPILGFFRHKRQVTEAESTPILSHKRRTSEETTNGEHRERKSPKELWRTLKRQMTQATFHMQDSTRENFSEMDAPYEFSVRDCILALIVYLSISILAYSFLFEDWTPIESMYFACVSFTTIGYGDYSPTTAGGRIFCCFFAIVGVCILGIALGVVGSRLIEGEVKAMKQAEENVTKKVLKLFSHRSLYRTDSSESLLSNLAIQDYSTHSSTCSNELLDTEHDTAMQVTWEQRVAKFTSVCSLFTRYMLALTPLMVGSILIGRHKGWTLDEVFYYMVCTCTTIGYGDFTPQQDSMKLFAIFYIPLGVGAMGHVLGSIANRIIDRRRQTYDKKLLTHEITLEDLNAMDQDHDGVVTELEFLVFMLVAMKKVDRGLTDRIRRHFHELDLTHSGTLVRRDLELMAKKRLRSGRAKLQLSQYKISLTSQHV